MSKIIRGVELSPEIVQSAHETLATLKYECLEDGVITVSAGAGWTVSPTQIDVSAAPDGGRIRQHLLIKGPKGECRLTFLFGSGRNFEFVEVTE